MALQTIIHNNPAKRMSLETFAGKLLDKVINASSEEAIERYIAVAMKALRNKKVNGYIIQRFIDKVNLCLKKQIAAGPVQEANIKIARARLKQFRQSNSF